MIIKFVACLKWLRAEKAQKVFWLMFQKAVMVGVQDEETRVEDTNKTRKEERTGDEERPCQVKAKTN